MRDPQSHGPKRRWWWPWTITGCMCGAPYRGCLYLQARRAAEVLLAERAAAEPERRDAQRRAAEREGRLTGEIRAAIRESEPTIKQVTIRSANGYRADGEQRQRRNVR